MKQTTGRHANEGALKHLLGFFFSFFNQGLTGDDADTHTRFLHIKKKTFLVLNVCVAG